MVGNAPILASDGRALKDALLLGADGVVLMAFAGTLVELETYRIVARVAGGCLRDNIPLVVAALHNVNERADR